MLKLVEKFERALTLSNYSIERIEKYWSFLKTIHKEIGVCFEDAKREDIERLIIRIEENSE